MQAAHRSDLEQIAPGVYRSVNWRTYDIPDGRPGQLSSGRMLTDDPVADWILESRLHGYRAQESVVKPLTPGSTRVTIRAYAHDRLVLCASGIPSPPARRKKRAPSAHAYQVRAARLLERHRETQNRFPARGGHGVIPQWTRFTRHLSTMVRDGGHIIERDTRGKSLFFTLTLPGGTQRAYDAMSAYSGRIVNNFNTWLRERCLNGYYVYVWELQSRGAPHLHYMVTVPKTATVRATHAAVQAEWRRILLNVSAVAGVDLFERKNGGTWRQREAVPFVHVRLCHADLGRYISKYASKSRSKASGAHAWRPGRWGALSYPLRAQVLKERVTVKVDFPSEPAARLALTHLVQAAAAKCHQPYVVPRDRTWGALVVSVDTFVRCAKPLALALKELATSGDATRLHQEWTLRELSAA